MKIKESDLFAGDFLFYRPSSFFGWAIAFMTASTVSHVEVYKGGGISFASRDGVGVGEYPLRMSGLCEVRRSIRPLNMGAMAIESKKHCGEAYDVGTIIKFITLGRSLKLVNAIGKCANALSFGKLGWNYKARVCSEHATHLGRAAGLTELMGDAKADEVTPNDLRKQSLLRRVFSK